MERKVDGEEFVLEGGELGTGEGFVGCCAADEGLVDLGAEEGAVAFDRLSRVKEKWMGMRGHLRMWKGPR